MAKRIQRSAKSTQQASSAKPRSAAGAGDASASSARGGRVKSDLITDFTVQLATLSEAGIPIVKALTILEGQMRPGRFKGILAEVTEDVASGTPLSESLGKHPACFDTLYSSMVRAGEAGGVLDRILTRLAAFREKAAEIRGKVIGAMIYPLILSLVAGGVITAVILFVIPRFEELFQSFNVELPQVTQVLLDSSTFAAKYWYVVVGLPVILLVSHFALLKRNEGYRHGAHGLLLKTPGIGGLVSRSMIADFSRTFGTLIQAGVPHLDALSIVRDATGNEVLIRGVESIRRTVREGEGIARPMGESGIFDDLVTNMVEVGEETGNLDGMLLKVADAYERQVDRQIDALFKVLEPLLLILMAVFVGFIVVALFMPLMEIMNSISGA
ncbi:pilus assembly protein PilC [Candidatus Woesearchaeota archaeon]|jgi:type IV pilus assembly protein PilC|nr:pilus assembly protein PilC [Candidatus Woesearchaeota archaeon]MDP6740985.1 type II secretion system F family protein [Planctomycetota bacterium]MDP6939307.1 type II secretion system F family protein [Planctomycetota bacterium]